MAFFSSGQQTEQSHPTNQQQGPIPNTGQPQNAQFLQSPGNYPLLPEQPQQLYNSQLHHQLQYNQLQTVATQQESVNNWKKVTYKRARPHQNTTSNNPKCLKTSQYWLDAPTTSNRYELLSDDEVGEAQTNSNQPPKPPPIFVTGVRNITPLIQLLNQIVEQYEIKALQNNEVKIQPKTADHYRIIIKALTEKQTEFHSYKLKEERNYRVVLKNMHHSTNIEEIKTEIEKLGHIVTNVWNIKNHRTKLPLPMFFIELKPAPNNKDIFNVSHLQQCKIKFEPPQTKRDIAQCARCQRYGHTKNFCNHKPRCVKCAGDHMTDKCQRKERSRDVQCVLCGGNHPANYKGCSVFKKLQQKKHPSLRPKTYTTPTQIPQYQQVQPAITYSQILRNSTNNATTTQTLATNSQHESNDIHELKQMMKNLFMQMGTLLSLLTTVLSKLK